MMHFAKILTFFLSHAIVLPLMANIDITSKQIDSTHHKLTLSFDVPRGDFIYKDYFLISTDSPDITLSAWHIAAKPIAHYDLASKQTKKIYNKPFTVTLTAHVNKPTAPDAHLYVSYYQHSRKKMVQQLFSLVCENEQQAASLLDAHLQQEKKPAHDFYLLWQLYLSMLKKYLQTIWTFFVLLFGLSLNAAALFIYPWLMLWYSSFYETLFLPLHTISWIMSIVVFSFGVVSLHTTDHKKMKTIIGMCAIVLAVLLTAQSYKMRYIHYTKINTNAVF